MVSIDTGGERTGGMVRLVGYLLPEANGNGISGLRTRSGDSELGYREIVGVMFIEIMGMS